MARRHFNWTLAIVLVVGSGVFVAAVFALHRWRVSSRAERALPVGEQAYDQQDWDKAVGRFYQYLTVHGDDVPVLLKYAEANLKRRPPTRGHIDRAIGAYRSVIRFDPNNTQAVRGLVEIYLAKAAWADAETIATQYLRKNDDPAVARMLARAMFRQRKAAEAQTVLLGLVKKHPEDVLAYEMLGRSAEEKIVDSNRPAASWYDEAVTVNPQSAVAYLVRATYFFRTGDRDKTMADLDRAEKCDLSDYDTRLGLAATLIQVNALDRAREHLKALQAQDPTKVGLWALWLNLARRGSLEEMATVADTGLKALGAGRWDFLPDATEALILAGQTDKAAECITQMREKELMPDRVAFLEGLLYEKQGRLRDAVTAWQKSLTLSPREKDPRTRLRLASALSQLGDLPSAISQLRSLTSEWPDYVDGHVRLAKYLIQTRDPASALKEVERFARDNPEASMVEVQAQILLASQGNESTADRERRWQDIDAHLQKLDKDTGGNPQVRLLQAQAAMERGKSAEATQLLNAVEKERPSDIQVSLLQAEMLVKQGKPDEAIAVLRAAAEQFPQDIRPVQQMAILLKGQKDQAQCESVVKQAIARMERPEARRDLGVLLGGLYRSWTREDTAQQWLTDLAQQFPNDIQVKRGLLACPAVVRNTAQAQTLVDEIKNIEKDAGWQWRYEQARVWINANSDKDPSSRSIDFKKNYYSRAVALLQENLRANPDDEGSRLLLAQAHELAGQQQLALFTYREALTRSPDNLEVIQRTVVALFIAGNVDEAQKIIAEAGERPLYHPALEKLDLAGQKLQSQVQLQRGAVGSAAEILKDVLARDPNDLSVSLSLALISMRQGKLDEAAILLKQLRVKAPEAIGVIEAQVQLYLLQGNRPEALRLCDEMIQTQNNTLGYRIRARIYAASREKEKAISDLNQVVAIDADNAGAWVERGAYYQQIGLRSEAIADLRKAMALAAGASAVLQGVLPVCLASGSPTLIREAEAELDKARSADPSDPGLKMLKVSFLLAEPTRPSIEQSQRLLREVTDAEPKWADAWRILANLELSQNQPARALDTTLRGLSFNENNKSLLLLRADTATAYSPVLAKSTLKDLMETYPGDWEVERRLASALYRSGSKSEGRSMLDARIKAEPNNPVPVLTLIELLARDNDLEEVTRQVSDWRARRPSDVDFVTRVAGTLVTGSSGGTEAMQMAENLARTVLDRDPNSTRALQILAVLTQRLGRTEEYIGFARKVLEREPNDLATLNNLAWSLCEDKRQYEEALALAERGLRIMPKYMDLIDTRGVILYRLNRLEKAVEDFSTCNDWYLAGASQLVSTRFHLARVYAKMGRKSQAQEQLKQSLEQQKQLQDPSRGLSPADMAEANSLLEQLQKGE